DRRDHRLLHMQLKPGGEDEQAPDAVDDGGNAGQKLDGDADRTAQQPRAEFGEEDGDADADGYRDQHGDQAGDQGAVDRAQGAEALAGRTPGFGDDEVEAEGLEGGHGAGQEREDHA